MEGKLKKKEELIESESEEKLKEEELIESESEEKLKEEELIEGRIRGETK